MGRPPRGSIGWVTTLSEMFAAMEWGLTPSSWYEEPRWARRVMVAAWELKRDIAYWQAEDSK